MHVLEDLCRTALIAAPPSLGISLGIQPRLLESTRVKGDRTEVRQSCANPGVSTESVHLLIRWSPVRTLPASEHAGTAHGKRPRPHTVHRPRPLSDRPVPTRGSERWRRPPLDRFAW